MPIGSYSSQMIPEPGSLLSCDRDPGQVFVFVCIAMRHEPVWTQARNLRKMVKRQSIGISTTTVLVERACIIDAISMTESWITISSLIKDYTLIEKQSPGPTISPINE